MPLTGACVWTLDDQVVALFRKVMELLGGALMGQALRVYSLAQPAILILLLGNNGYNVSGCPHAFPDMIDCIPC